MIFKGPFQPKPLYDSMMIGEKAEAEAFFLFVRLSSASIASHIQVVRPTSYLKESQNFSKMQTVCSELRTLEPSLLLVGFNQKGISIP